MVKLVVFDMDGVLIDSERLKGLSYAKAVHRLSEGVCKEEEVYSAFSEVVGSSREVVVDFMMNRFSLQNYVSQKSETHKPDLESTAELLSQTRLTFYKQMLSDTAMIKEAEHREVIALLHWLKDAGVSVGIATMSGQEEAERMLDRLGVLERLDFLMTRDSVEQPKPHPEIYLKAIRSYQASEVLVVEDSLSGIRSAQAAGLDLVVLLTEITKNKVQNAEEVKSTPTFESESSLAEHVKALVSNG